MAASNSVALVSDETPEDHPERQERIAAAREVDIAVTAFADTRPWTLDGFVSGTAWPEEHASMFESSTFLRHDEELGFDTEMLSLEHADHIGDATDLLGRVRAVWEAEGREVFTMEESPGSGRETYIWSYGNGMKTEMSAHVSDDDTVFRLVVTVSAPPPEASRL